MTTGEKIKSLRTQKGVSVRALAEGVGISHTQIVHLENDFDTHTGKAPRLSLDAFVKICEYFQCDYISFLEETGYIKKKAPTLSLVEDENESILIDIYRALPDDLQRNIVAFAKSMALENNVAVNYTLQRKVSQ